MENLYQSIKRSHQELIYTFKRLLNDYFDWILCKSNSRLYTILFNLRSFLIGNKAKVFFGGNIYFIKEKGLKNIVYFFSKEIQGSYAYKFGLKRRAKKLSEEYLLNKISFNENDKILDCGANNGDLKLWFHLNHLEIEYVAFEPSIDEFKCLAKNTAPSTCHNIALWKSNETKTFYVNSQSADSSIIKPRYVEEEIKVKAMRIENFIDKRIKLLKLEAEGAELEILIGAGDKLKLIDFISADLGFEKGLKQESTFIPVTNYLFNRGFQLVEVNHKRCVALFRNNNYS